MLFARKLTKSPYIKEYLKEKYNNKCLWCKHNLNDNFVVHHIDYDHECIYKDYIKIAHPTEKRPNKTYKVPNCEKCFKENNNKFNECISKIVPIHKLCNLQIEEAYQKLKADQT